MAISFPTNRSQVNPVGMFSNMDAPIDGDTYTYEGDTYTYDNTNGNNRWIADQSGGASVTVSRTPPTAPADGDLWWYCGDDGEDPGLFTYAVDMNGVGGWLQSSPGLAFGGATPIGGATVTLETGNLVNGLENRIQIVAGDFIEEGGTLIIPADFWVWSDDVAVAALIVDRDDVTIMNNGNIIGRGGDGGNVTGGAGGPAIEVLGTNVNIINNAGAFIAGGGGGGNRGGGGGAGGGMGGNNGSLTGGAGGTLGMGGAGGYAGYIRNQDAQEAGTGGGRSLPGVGQVSPSRFAVGQNLQAPTGNGGDGGVQGNRGATQGDDSVGGGGGGWGAAGGLRDSAAAGAAGGAAVGGELAVLSTTTVTNDGTIFGTSP